MVASLDHDATVSDIRTSDALIADSVARPKFAALLLTLFAAVAVCLAAIGVYGVLTYSLSRRTQEIGVRLALGARGQDVLRLLLVEGLRLTVTGLVLGLAAAAGVTRALSTLLYGVEPIDVALFGSVATVLLFVGLVAAYVPARRAARVSPVNALRID